MRSAEISGLEEIEEEIAKEKAEKKAAKAAKKAAKKGESIPPVEETSAVSEAVTSETEGKAIEETAVTPDTQAEITEEASAKPDVAEKKESSIMMTVIMVVSIVFAVAIMLGLFIWLPTFLYKDVLEKYISWFPQGNRFLQSVFEGVLRVCFLVGYMSLMILMKDIRRTYQYHGAEHKAIFCYEAGLELTVENVRRQKRFHPRCGTSFLVLMMLVSIVVGFFIPPSLGPVWRTVVRFLLVPVIMGLGYELIKLCGRCDNWLTRIIAAPGKGFQHITVFEPDDRMIECAIAALKAVIPEDGSDNIR